MVIMNSSVIVKNELNEKKRKYIIFGFVYLSFFLDNVLLTVVVPIIPDYLHSNSVQLLKNSPLFNIIPISKESTYNIDPDIISNNRSKSVDSTSKSEKDYPDFMHPGKYKMKTKLNKSEETFGIADLGYDEKMELDKENVQVGLLLSSKALVQLFLNPVIGWWTSKVGYKVPIFFGGINLVLASVVFAFGESVCWLLLARCVQGIASACVGVAGLGLLAEVFAGTERPKVMGLVLGSVALGVLVGYPFGGFLYEFANKSTPFLAIGFFTVCNLVLQLIYMDFGNINQDSSPEHPMPGAQAFTPATYSRHGLSGSLELSVRPPTRSWLALCGDVRVRAAASAVFVSTCALAVLEPCLPIWLMTHLRPKKWQLGTVFIPDSLGYLLGTNLFGLIAYRVGPWCVSVVALFAVGVSAIMVPAARSLQQLLIPHFCLGLGIGAVDASLAPLIAERADIDTDDDNSEHVGGNYGAVFALHQTAVSLAYFLAPFLGGELTHQFGFEFTMRVVGFANILYATLLVWYIWRHHREGQAYKLFDFDEHHQYGDFLLANTFYLNTLFRSIRLLETNSINNNYNNNVNEMTTYDKRMQSNRN